MYRIKTLFLFRAYTVKNRRKSDIMYIFFSVLFIFVLLCLLLNHRRKICIIKKVRSIPSNEKCRFLNELIMPLGYQYLSCPDIFISAFDAWQRNFGYTNSYDCLAPYFNMVFDREPVYFDYDNRTWLIELWKGQYGINTGAEIGIYCADSIVPPDQRKRQLFHTVPDEVLPVFAMNLKRNVKQKTEELAEISRPHWWLAAFCMGCFSRPDNLSAQFCITFTECKMAREFVNALIRLGYPPCSVQICNSRVCFSFTTPKTPASCGLFAKPVRCLAQLKNRFFCRIFLFVTRPFCCTSDRLLYLYFYLPFIFRRCLRLRRYGKSQKRSRNL